MKKIIYIILPLFLGVFSSCSDFLDVQPIATQTEQNFFTTPANAVIAINAIYDVIDQAEGTGPDGQWINHNYEFMYGDVLADDCEKGSEEKDLADYFQVLVEWRATPENKPNEAQWIKFYDGINRANTALKWLETSPLEASLKERLKGEAYFLKGLFYFDLVRIFGGVPIIDKPLSTSEFGTIKRASLHETFDYAAEQFKMAITRLPLKSEYAAADMGRATKGAAQGYLARTYLYQIGMDKENTLATYQLVYDLTSEIMASGQYSLMNNYAQIFEPIGENGSESIFELQFIEGSSENQPTSTGTINSVFTNNRGEWGWGFQQPTQNLFDAYGSQDPRLFCSLYGSGVNDGVYQGKKHKFLEAKGSMTPYYNRKTALAEQAALAKSSGANIRLMRYAEILFNHAEAAIQLGKLGEAEDNIEMVNSRARTSTYPCGWKIGTLSYESTGWSNNIPRVGIAGLSKDDAITTLLAEKRKELSNESLRYWDLVRTGKYLDMLDVKKATFKNMDGTLLRYKDIDLRGNCLSHCIDGAGAVKVPLMPIPLVEVNSWGLTQNIGY